MSYRLGNWIPLISAIALTITLMGCGDAGTTGGAKVSGGGSAGSGGAAGNGLVIGTAGGTAGSGDSGGSDAMIISGGAAGMIGAGGSACPDLHAPPADCPAKVYQGSVVIKTQADADALAGYTDIQGSVNVGLTVGSDAVVNLDALHCLQTTLYELVVDRAQSLTSLDGLRELTEVGGWVDIDNNPLARLGCGLRKLTKVGTHGTAYVEFDNDAQLDRIELPLLTDSGHFRVDTDAALQSILGSPMIDTLGQFFVRANPALASLSGFTGLKRVTELRLNDNPMLPVCQAQAIVDGLSAPPAIASDTSGDLGASCQ